MSFSYRVYYKWPDNSRINDGSKGVASEIETRNPVVVGDFVEAPIGNGYVKVQQVVHDTNYSWLFVCSVTESEKEIMKLIPKY